MRAARPQAPQVVAAAARQVAALVWSIAGLQPEKGHETLDVVRALNAKRLWFAEALRSSPADEVRRLLSQARAWATPVGLSVPLGVVGPTRGVRDRDRGGVARRPASGLRPAFSARLGEAHAGGG